MPHPIQGRKPRYFIRPQKSFALILQMTFAMVNISYFNTVLSFIQKIALSDALFGLSLQVILFV